ncbi:MAG: hypothetical protein F4Y82_05475 [Cenarchaeum sp. SB0665_bin_23]|nr:hypothetical protein [Cenarchaeum sp. SB0667_bin_13]MXY37977.1 hypothetical protein [Cenarchaeum sp. SB0664_bin_35]MXY61542.1 hypothetical protein [Cenarchaeum sp. SB0665_bin_23]MXZ93803.1 hypothetical protein [Cenarchaeum sp. SB0666_bin_15]MYB46976.1 hypothetical protein [Cenarchaeum sp. SB0662_bin_33]MYC80261.1 hypothetical protein [Cenarchaeum sp. SB0661_bin_35]MYD58793.1 hypothetical protein [Cenarchaeum sp. SB0678_bin_8]MYG33268.1 hypothetical protein [Cenarchaeum sp. SB0677_bin_16]
MGEMTFGRKYTLIFVGILALAGVIIGTVVFPFWNLIREEIYEDVIILSNNDGVCVADTADEIPKHIEDCTYGTGDAVTIKYGEGLAWATIVEP